MNIELEQPKKGFTQKEIEYEIFKIGCMILLFERENETQLRTAFAALVQERHNHFHSVAANKEGDGSKFEDCSNQLCQSSLAILQEGRSPKIEFNPITTKLLDKYNLHISRTPNSCSVSLVSKEENTGNLILEV